MAAAATIRLNDHYDVDMLVVTVPHWMGLLAYWQDRTGMMAFMDQFSCKDISMLLSHHLAQERRRRQERKVGFLQDLVGSGAVLNMVGGCLGTFMAADTLFSARSAPMGEIPWQRNGWIGGGKLP